MKDQPAFPCHTNPLPGKLANAPQGMTLRQYYKAAALPAVILQYTEAVKAGLGYPPSATQIGEHVGLVADAMLAEDEAHGKAASQKEAQ